MDPDLSIQLETVLRNALQERRVENRVVRPILSDLRATLAAIERTIGQSGVMSIGPGREQAIRRLVDAIAVSVQRTWGVPVIAQLGEVLQPWFTQQLDFARAMVELSGGTLTNPGTVAATNLQVQAAVNNAIVNGKTLSQTLSQGIPAIVADRVERYIRLGLSDVAGETFATYQDAVVRTVGNNVEAILRTGVHEVGSAAQQAIYQIEADPVWLSEDGLVWTAVLDSSVCPVCLKLDGKRFPFDYQKVSPHLNCRCSLLPWRWTQDMTDPDGNKVPQTRLSRGDDPGDDYIPVKTAMRDWLQSNPETTRTIFGKARGQQLLDRKLSLDKAVRDWVTPRET